MCNVYVTTRLTKRDGNNFAGNAKSFSALKLIISFSALSFKDLRHHRGICSLHDSFLFEKNNC